MQPFRQAANRLLTSLKQTFLSQTILDLAKNLMCSTVSIMVAFIQLQLKSVTIIGWERIWEYCS